MKRPFGLPKSARLKSRKLISRLFSEGEHVFNYPFKLVYLYVPEPEETEMFKMGVSVSKKRIRSAVKRNLVKRRTREAYRIHRNAILGSLEPADGWFAIMLIYVGNQIEPYALIEQGMKTVLKKMKHAVRPRS